MELNERIKTEGRIMDSLLPQVFDVERWITENLDDSIVDWQIQHQNSGKSIPLLLLFLLPRVKRNIMKQLYLELYDSEQVLPEWDCVPMYTELELFVTSEDNFFQVNYGFSFSEFFDPDWQDVISDDVCYCDFEMLPVTTLLHLED